MAKPCVITFKGKDYKYSEYLSMLYNGGLEQLIDDGTLNINDLKGNYDAISFKKSDEEMFRLTIEGRGGELELQRMGKQYPKKYPGKKGEVKATRKETGEEEVKLQAESTDRIKDILDKLVTAGALKKIDRNVMLSKIVTNLLTQTGAKTEQQIQNESFALLYELIKEKGNLAGQRMSNKAFSVLRDEINDLLKTLLPRERTFITRGQLNSIRNRALAATTPKARQKVIDYINDTVIWGNGAKLKMRFADAEELQNKIAKRNKGEKSDFGSARKVADRVENIDLEQLSYDELQDFINVARKIFPVGKEVDTERLTMLDTLFGDKQIKDEEKIKNINTVNGIIEYISKLDSTTVIDVSSYIAFRRKLNYAIKHANQVIAQLEKDEEKSDSQNSLDTQVEYIQKLVDEKLAEFQQELDAFRVKYANYVISKLKSVSPSDIEGLFEDKEDTKTAQDILDIEPADIKDLSIEHLSELNTSVNNILSGNITPQMEEMLMMMDALHDQKLIYQPGLEIVNTDKTGSWKRIRQSGGFAWAQRTFLPKFMRKSELESELVEQIKAKQWFRLDTWLGNVGSTKKIGTIFAKVGKMINQSERAKYKFDQAAGEAYNTFQKNKNGEEQKMWLKRIGMFMAENRWQSSDYFEKFPSYLHQIFVTNYAEEKKRATDPFDYEKDFEEYQNFMSWLRENGATKTVNDIEIIDIDKTKELLEKDKGVATMLKFATETFTEYRGMNKKASRVNGRSLIWGDNYVPFMRKYKGDDIESESSIKSWISKSIYNANLTSGSTHEWTGQKMYIELDIMRILNSYTESIRRNYFIYPELRKNVMALREAAKAVSAKNIETKGEDLDIGRLSRAIIEATRSRIATYYNANYLRNESKTLKFVEVGAKKGMLVKPDKFMSEFFGNSVRIMLEDMNIPVDALSKLIQDRTLWNDMISQWIGENLWSAYGTEVNYKLIGKTVGVGRFRRILKKGESAADWMIKTPDKGAGMLLFIKNFSKQFKDLTGEEFDINLYQTDHAYQVRVKDAVEESMLFADSRVEELFNSKNPMSDPELISFFGGLIKKNKTNVLARIFNTLQSFGRNDSNQLADSYRRYKYGDEKTKLMARRDLLAVISSNFFYGIFRRLASIGAMAYFYQPLGDLIESLFVPTGDDDDKDKKNSDENYYDAQKKQILSGKFIFNYATEKVALDMLLGGSSNIFEYAGKLGLYTVEKTIGLSDEAKETIYDFFKVRYIERLPTKYTSLEASVFAAAPPLMQPVFTDFFSFSQSLIETVPGNFLESLYISTWDAHDKGVILQKDVYDLINLINITMKYVGFNPAVPPLERRIKARLYELQKQEKEIKKKYKGGGKKKTEVSPVGLR